MVFTYYIKIYLYTYITIKYLLYQILQIIKLKFIVNRNNFIITITNSHQHN